MDIDTLKLYEINDKLRAALEAVNEMAEAADGEIPESWSTFIDDINIAKENKILDIGRYIKSLTAQADGVKAEIDKLKRRHKTYTNQIERMQNYLSWNMEPDERYKDNNTMINFRKSHVVKILNADIIPSIYLKTETTIMKSLIKQDLKNGVEIEGAIISPNYTLSIK